MFLRGFPGFFKKTKEKKDREGVPRKGIGKSTLKHTLTHWHTHTHFSRTSVCRVKNAVKSGICSCKASREKWREMSCEKFWAISSFVSSGTRSSKISPEISRHFPWQLSRTVSGEIFKAADDTFGAPSPGLFLAEFGRQNQIRLCVSNA